MLEINLKKLLEKLKSLNLKKLKLENLKYFETKKLKKTKNVSNTKRHSIEDMHGGPVKLVSEKNDASAILVENCKKQCNPKECKIQPAKRP